MSGVGITPAWAGKSQTLHFNSHRTGDHPRVGGEKYAGRRHRGDLKGSPPRGRGKVHEGGGFILLCGITPAWAGKSAGFQSAPSGQRDHPRVGGEKAVWLCAGPRPHGSPPRGRGKAPGPLALRISSRITPAWAGKSKRPAFPVCVMWDHPRVGGEKPEWTSLEEIERGSPPRGRGKVFFGRMEL